MIVGKIIGTANTKEFKFLVTGKIKKFDYVQVYNENGHYCLCQVVELSRDDEKKVADCIVLGFKDSDGLIKLPREPFKPGTEVLVASDDFIKEVIEIQKNGLFIGFLEGKRIPVYLDTNKLLTKHLAVIAKSGSGKSYAMGVITEEILKKDIPLLIIDPHGEYSSLRFPNYDSEEELKKIGLKPIGFSDKVVEYGDPQVNPKCAPLRLKENLTPEEFVNLFPAKLNSSQQVMLYNILRTLEEPTIDDIILALETENSSAKINLITQLKYLKNTGLFDSQGVIYSELIKKGVCSIINLKGYSWDVQTLIVHKILSDLFLLRKRNEVPPFFCIIEEAHNFCPERSFGEAKSSQIIRTIASEGRKFGLGLAIVSQRPARVDKNVLSQCSTQIILKTTNPNDLKAISNSVEGLTSESEKEIRNLPIGTAIVSGVLDRPLFVKIRPRQTKHGGDAFNFDESNEKIIDKPDALPLIKPRIPKKDLEIITNKKLKEVLVPAVYLTLESGNKKFKVLFDLINGFVIKDIDKRTYLKEIPREPAEMESFYKIEFVQDYKFDKKLEPKISENEVVSKVDKLFKVVSKRHCFFVLYAPEN
ncbi:MAG: hypothetical protein PWP03_67 [Candidatus Woesearchaeota archaeon]|nr:hypothetical protein [Candidatus Woesearchaeota archaeon]